ncbi:MAG: M48 family metallopeptidase, partial [Gammaproteobacteria bacterium]|nr:M48 family metallopeptidase [Gammaproteobacteria bacterium]
HSREEMMMTRQTNVRRSSPGSLRLTLVLGLVAGLFNGCATTTVTARGSVEDVANERAKQEALAISTTWKREARLQDLSWPLLTSSTQLCADDVRNRFGIVHTSLDAIDKRYRHSARSELLIGVRPQVIHVIKGSPADLAGVNPYDVLMSVDGEEVAAGRGSGKKFAKRLDEVAKTGQPVTFEVERRDQRRTFVLDPVAACKYRVVLVPNDSLNAFADGNNVYVTQGMIRFAETDEELQLVLAHEIAHNSERHIDKQRGNAVLGGIFDVVAAVYGVNTQGAFSNMSTLMFSQEFEREADYVGMYMLARAGIDTIEVANFWRKMAAEYPAAIRGTFASSHPATSERYANIEAAHDEVVLKLAAGSELVPERK